MTDTFDIGKTVREYRRLWKLQDVAKSPAAKVEYKLAIDKLKASWKAWNGGDAAELHETAFG